MNRIIVQSALPNGIGIALVHGDITEERVDAIVNPANEHLAHGGGVAGLIVRKGGRIIQQESDAIGHVPTGEAAVTGAGALPCRCVIHAVGPVWGSGNEDVKLESAACNSLRRAAENDLKIVSMPAISSGIFGFPKDRCAEVLLNAVVNYRKDTEESAPEQVRFCLFDQVTLDAFVNAWSKNAVLSGR